jgi:hypothetical protein
MCRVNFRGYHPEDLVSEGWLRQVTRRIIVVMICRELQAFNSGNSFSTMFFTVRKSITLLLLNVYGTTI